MFDSSKCLLALYLTQQDIIAFRSLNSIISLTSCFFLFFFFDQQMNFFGFGPVKPAKLVTLLTILHFKAASIKDFFSLTYYIEPP